MNSACPPRPLGPAEARTRGDGSHGSEAWLSAACAQLQREWALALARPADWLIQGLFFACIASLPALSVSPTPQALALLAPGVLWVAALLSVLLVSARCFDEDLHKGWLDQCLLSGVPMALLLGARLLAQWVQASLPVLLLTPLVALQYRLAPPALGVLMLALSLGLLTLVMLAGVVAALAAGLRQGALLVVGLVLPLAVPVLIFGSMAVRAAQGGESAAAHLSLLAAMACASVALCPWLAAAAVRIGIEA